MGQATVRELRELGAEVVGLDLVSPEETVDEFLRVDMSLPWSIDEAVPHLGRVDALFNCVGLSNGAAPPEQVIRVNFLGPRRLTDAIVPSMGSGSSIVSVASLGGQGWEQNLDALLDLCRRPSWEEEVEWFAQHHDLWPKGPYGVTKQAIIVYTKLRCVELARRGIRINSIAPGVTQTPFLIGTIKSLGSEEALDRIPKPLGRRAEPEEQARALVFLNSDAASYITGQNIWTDAGFMAGHETGTLEEDFSGG
jgi:NAD(P)-dependent dehydrogenase (short-subunit alcohol dehydrogenase family)